MIKEEFVSAVKGVFDACRHLSKISGEIRQFTPDGRMVGDIGELIACSFYQVTLHGVGRHYWDGVYNNRNVQIKATGGDTTYLKEPPAEGYSNGLLMVFKIDRNSGDYSLVYNGDIGRVWGALDNLQSNRNGEKTISLNRLREIQKAVQGEDIVPALKIL